MQFSFIQDSQLEIESPHMDPAVVAVSSHVPPQPPQIQTQPDSNHMFVSVQAPPTEDLTSIQSGMRDLNVNHNNMNSNNVQEEDNKWDATTHNFSTTNGNVEGGEDNTNGFDRSGRGAYKGRGGGRGRGGFGARGNSRPPKGGSRGGFNNSNKNRFGRVERIGQSDAGALAEREWNHHVKVLKKQSYLLFIFDCFQKFQSSVGKVEDSRDRIEETAFPPADLYHQ